MSPLFTEKKNKKQKKNLNTITITIATFTFKPIRLLIECNEQTIEILFGFFFPVFICWLVSVSLVFSFRSFGMFLLVFVNLPCNMYVQFSQSAGIWYFHIYSLQCPSARIQNLLLLLWLCVGTLLCGRCVLVLFNHLLLLLYCFLSFRMKKKNKIWIENFRFVFCFSTKIIIIMWVCEFVCYVLVSKCGTSPK